MTTGQATTAPPVVQAKRPRVSGAIAKLHFVAKALAHHHIGLEETDDGRWSRQTRDWTPIQVVVRNPPSATHTRATEC